MFDRERESGYSGSNRKQKIKRMEELSHSLDDGLNILPDDYGRVQQQRSNRGGRVERRYDDMDDDEYEEYIDDYYYANSKSNFDGRPKSYNEKYNSYNYDEYEASGRNRYSLNDNKNQRYVQQSPVSQQKYSSLRKPQANPNVTAQQSSSSSGNGHHGSNKHILFNDEDDVMYMSEQQKKKSSSSSSSTGKKSVAASSGKKETKDTTTTAPSPSSSTKKKPSKESSEKSSLQVMKAKLKIHNLTSDDSVLHMRTSKLQNAFHRHHSVESKMPPSPSHHSDRSNMSPTIMEEIEFEVQDDEIETEPEKEVEKKGGKDKSSKEKDKKGNNSAPSTPTTMKSFKAHLSNHKKLFKVPDIDLNNLKLSCFFNKNIAALKGKKEESISKSVEALNAAEPSSSSKSSPTTKNPPASLKTPPLSPKKIIKSESKADKSIQEKQERANASAAAIVVEEKYEKTSKLDINDFDFEDEETESISEEEFQVIYQQNPKRLSNR